MNKTDIRNLVEERQKIITWLKPEIDPERARWETKARALLEEIDKALQLEFFPKPHLEGLKRKTKAGFVAMLKTSIARKVDDQALSVLLEGESESSKGAFKRESKVILSNFRKLPKDKQAKFKEAITEKPEKPVFQIAPIEESN